MRGRVPDGKVRFGYDHHYHGIYHRHCVDFLGGAVMDKQEFFTVAQIVVFFSLMSWFWCTLMDALAWSAW